MADDAPTTNLSLAEIDAAIRDIMETGQEVVIGDREYKAADLDKLRKLRNEVAAAERSQQGTMFKRVTFGRVC